jgi:hypothetical protein
MEVKVQVNKGDIVHGKRHNPCECAVARAIRRAVPGSYPVVGYADVAVAGARVNLPEEVGAAIHAIDAGWGKYVQPFTFTLELPAEALDAAAA